MLYLEKLKRKGGPALYALKLHRPLRNLLIRILDDGWTGAGEQRTIQFLRELRAP